MLALRMSVRVTMHMQSLIRQASNISELLDDSVPFGSKPIQRPSVSPDETTILLFPGQGSQYIGMGESLLDVPGVREMFSRASAICNYDLLSLCLKGPAESLDRTVYCQPAVFLVSLAAVEKLRHSQPEVIEKCVAAAGYSLGEITALVFSGALTFEDGLKLVKVRAEAMQMASEAAPSGMMTVFCGHQSKLNYACLVAREWCKKQGINEVEAECRIASYLYPDCKVVAGHEVALEFIEKNARDFKLLRCRRLPVSGAFHTDLMKSAAEPVRALMKRIPINPPLVKVYSNLDGHVYHTVKQIQRNTPKLLYKPVKWEQTMHAIYERKSDVPYPTTFECGPGGNLRKILERVNAKAASFMKTFRV